MTAPMRLARLGAPSLPSMLKDKRTVTFNVVTGATLLALGATVLACQDGMRVTALLVGTPA